MHTIFKNVLYTAKCLYFNSYVNHRLELPETLEQCPKLGKTIPEDAFIPYEILLISFYAVFSSLNSCCKYAQFASDAVSIPEATPAWNNSVEAPTQQCLTALFSKILPVPAAHRLCRLYVTTADGLCPQCILSCSTVSLIVQGRTHLAMLSKTASAVLSSHKEQRSQDDEYVPALSTHVWIGCIFLQVLVFSIIIGGLSVFCLRYWEPNLKHLQQACSGDQQSMRIFNSMKAAAY